MALSLAMQELQKELEERPEDYHKALLYKIDNEFENGKVENERDKKIYEYLRIMNYLDGYHNKEKIK